LGHLSEGTIPPTRRLKTRWQCRPGAWNGLKGFTRTAFAEHSVGEVLGLPEAKAYGPFAELKLDNSASLAFMDTEGEIHGQHYAFLVSEEEFDLILGRLQDDGRQWWADPFKQRRMIRGSLQADGRAGVMTP
jgi:hypothetical protein